MKSLPKPIRLPFVAGNEDMKESLTSPHKKTRRAAIKTLHNGQDDTALGQAPHFFATCSPA